MRRADLGWEPEVALCWAVRLTRPYEATTQSAWKLWIMVAREVSKHGSHARSGWCAHAKLVEFGIEDRKSLQTARVICPAQRVCFRAG